MEEITELLNALICNPDMIHSQQHSRKEPPIEQRRLDNEIARTLEGYLRLWNALNSLPEIQGRRIDAHIILGKSIKEIAEAEGVHEESIRQSIKRGLERMKKTF